MPVLIDSMANIQPVLLKAGTNMWLYADKDLYSDIFEKPSAFKNINADKDVMFEVGELTMKINGNEFMYLYSLKKPIQYLGVFIYHYGFNVKR